MTGIDTIIRRGDCFKLLAACFYEPDKRLFLEEQVCDKLKELLQLLTPPAVCFTEAMQSGLIAIEQDQLALDHAALFVGPFELIAAPYGSVYTERTRRVMGESTMDALRYYQEAGLSVELKEPPDHIVIELEFMYFLCNREAAYAQDGLRQKAMACRAMQGRFYQGALQPWVGQFCQAVQAGTNNKFYLNLAACLNCFLLSCEELYNQAHPTSAL